MGQGAPGVGSNTGGTLSTSGSYVTKPNFFGQTYGTAGPNFGISQGTGWFGT